MTKIEKPRKVKRVRVERAIYQSVTSGDYTIISYNKDTKKTATLFKCKDIEQARYYRDNNLRFALYGKGIEKRGKRYQASIMLYSGDKNEKSKVRSFYIGMYNTPEEARQARLDFIENLK